MRKARRLAGKIGTIRFMSSGPSPAESLTPIVRELFGQCGARKYGLTEELFQQILEKISDKYIPGSTDAQRAKLWRELKLEELALARGCAEGNEYAWEVFLTRYREKLYDIARGITKEDASAHE